jgi:formylglycine-generating enzyme required for sulfatase activity
VTFSVINDQAAVNDQPLTLLQKKSCAAPTMAGSFQVMNVPGWLMTVAMLMSLSIGRALAGETATAVATITAGFVTGITVTSGGSGYTVEPKVTLSGGGGSGATAKVILSGDKVALILVLTAGSGYSTAPTVVVDSPPKVLSVRVRLVPELTVEGPPGSLAQVESATSLTGPWTTWTNVTVGAEGTVLVDLSPGSSTRFYRSSAVQPVKGPAGFVWIPPGTFVMGSPFSEAKFSEETQHTVTLTQGFWISDHEVTQVEFESVMGRNPSYFAGLNLPVERTTWFDAVAYCEKLTEREKIAGRIAMQQEYRLPTEAEWEYAARAGTTGAMYGALDKIAWYSLNSGFKTHEVNQKASNPWGIYDMLGNVWEWCSDWYGDYPIVQVTDPTGPKAGQLGDYRVIRGGSYEYDSRFIRSAVRSNQGPNNGNKYHIGFRPVLSAVR